MTYFATQCPCGHRACKDWHVTNAADIQGVHFTEDQSHAVAFLLNEMERCPTDPTITVVLPMRRQTPLQADKSIS